MGGRKVNRKQREKEEKRSTLNTGRKPSMNGEPFVKL